MHFVFTNTNVTSFSFTSGLTVIITLVSWTGPFKWVQENNNFNFILINEIIALNRQS